jgi:hypothetical protein
MLASRKNSNLIIFLFIFLSLFIMPLMAKDEAYQKGKLQDVDSKQYLRVVDGTGKTYDVYFLSIKVDGITYTGSYKPSLLLRRERPTEWIVGDAVDVRFNDKKTKMYLKKSNGGELTIKITKKVRS